jgi:hypothetical protein
VCVCVCVCVCFRVCFKLSPHAHTLDEWFGIAAVPPPASASAKKVADDAKAVV